jgi:hypothetical protein
MSKLKLSSNASGSGNVTLQSPNTNSDFTVTVPTGTGALPLMRLETAVASTSGTSIDFTSIPSWVKRITVMFSGVSTNGTSSTLVQLGDSGGIENTGYVCQANRNGSGSTSGGTSTAGFIILQNDAATNLSGPLTIAKVNGNTWVVGYSLGSPATTNSFVGGGTKTLSDTLTQVRITTVNGTDTFDAGTINILYEG